MNDRPMTATEWQETWAGLLNSDEGNAVLQAWLAANPEPDGCEWELDLESPLDMT